MSSMHRLLALALSWVLAAAAIPGAAQAATAGYEAITRVTLTLTLVNAVMSIPDGLTVKASASISDQYQFTTDNGAAQSEATLHPTQMLTMGIDDQLIQYAHSLGQAGHREGYAESGIETDGVISIENAGTETAELRFTYDLYAAIIALLDGDGITAVAQSDWIIGDEAGQVSIVEGLYADAENDVHPVNWIESGSFTLTVAGGESAALWALAGARGVAEAPEPPLWTLLCVGLYLVARPRARAVAPGPRQLFA